MTTTRRPRVLLVDDQGETRGFVAAGLQVLRPPFDIEFATSAAEACEKLSRNCYDACVIDVNLLGTPGIEVAAQAHEKCPAMPKAFWTGYRRSETRGNASAFDMPTWPKPITAGELFARIEGLIAGGTGAAEGAAGQPLAVPAVISSIAAAVLTAAGLMAE